MAGNCLHILLPVDFSNSGLVQNFSEQLPKYLGEVSHDEHSGRIASVVVERHGETVLLVDDEATVRMLIADALSEQGYVVIEAADSAAGLTLLRSDVHIDLLVTDVGLPGGMNGRQMADAGLELRPDVKVLLITGYAESAVIDHGQLNASMEVLTKPFAVDQLEGRVRDMLAE